ncbi:class I SAM-dependent methyltransferase [Salinicoccus jeotgali]|uniref:Class I SAM-dependent methyltransferase n=1 Tax=Salinicoccus jeotgali TaxID=381634 RepID=A0ABP7EUT2_9STAP
MIITTGGRTDEQTVLYAYSLADKYDAPYIKRSKRSIETLKRHYHQDVVVVSRSGIIIHPFPQIEPIHFHPNMAMVRAKRILEGKADPFIKTAGLESGMHVLDCTMGLAADSLIASLAVGDDGRVTALESDPLLYLAVSEGLKHFTTQHVEIREAMSRIEALHAVHHEFLQRQEDNSFDVIYFDPMFTETVETSDAMQVIHEQTDKSDLSLDTITEARRVARERIVMKDHWQSSRFHDLGFVQEKRPSSLFHYGYINIDLSE